MNTDMNTFVLGVILSFTTVYLAIEAYWERRDYHRIKANLEKLHHAHLESIVRENKANGRCADLERDLRNAQARLAQADQPQAAQPQEAQPPVVCITHYRTNQFSRN